MESESDTPKTGRWKQLAESFGLDPNAPAPAPPPSPPVPQPAAPPPSRAKRQASPPSPPRRPSSWGSLAADLGLAEVPAEPDREVREVNRSADREAVPPPRRSDTARGSAAPTPPAEVSTEIPPASFPVNRDDLQRDENGENDPLSIASTDALDEAQEIFSDPTFLDVSEAEPESGDSASLESSERGEAGDGAPRRKRRRRRRRGRGERPDSSVEESANANGAGEPVLVEADRSEPSETSDAAAVCDDQPVEQSAKQSSDESEPSRRRRRRRRRGKGDKTRAETDSAASVAGRTADAVAANDDEDDEDQEDLDDALPLADGESSDKHRQIPTWFEAVDILVQENLRNRGKRQQSSPRGRGRR